MIDITQCGPVTDKITPDVGLHLVYTGVRIRSKQVQYEYSASL